MKNMECEEGCCPTCDGTGASSDIETGGRCWDCYGTGHAHDTHELHVDQFEKPVGIITTGTIGAGGLKPTKKGF
jgi:DnaJ-class molecular chaperone